MKPHLSRLLLFIAIIGLDPFAAAKAESFLLLSELNCVACHAPTAALTAWLLPKAAPRLTEMGSRISAAWLQRYLTAPHETLPGTTMPDLLRGNSAQAEALTHYLLSLAPVKFQPTSPDPAAIARGEKLYHRVGCVACHAPQNTDLKPSGSAPLPRLAEKWSLEGLRRFLRDPLATRPSGRMPAMHLTEGEAGDIARYLLREAEVPVQEATPFVVDAAKATTGRALYQKLNCAACHESKAPAVSLPALANLQPTRGCLADQPAAQTPDYHLDSRERDALRAALAALNRPDLPAPSAEQRVNHTMATLRCTACHARGNAGGVAAERDAFFTSNGEDLGDEGRVPPSLDDVGDRLRPAWLSNVLATGASVRPYFGTRMPQFGLDNVGHLVDLFVALDRHPQPIPQSPDSFDVQREVGRRLTGTDGLSCIACHRFNRQPAHALQVIDLAMSRERLNEDWFYQFLRDPNRFHPGTRMPAFWPNGVSPLPALLGGGTDRQLAALWTYLAEGARAKFPEGLSRQNLELVVGGEAVVYRGKLWEAGFRAVAVGYPGQLNAAFDAEEMRLSLLWRGRFLNAGPHWGVQGMGSIRPLSSDVAIFPHGPALAVLAKATTPWPTNAPKELGAKFRGYQLDGLKRPTLLYSFRNVGIEDFLTPTEVAGKAGLRRTLKFAGVPPLGLRLRIAVGKLASLGDNSWRLNDALTLHVAAGANGFVRGDAEQQELLVPITVREEKSQLEIEYVW